MKALGLQAEETVTCHPCCSRLSSMPMDRTPAAELEASGHTVAMYSRRF